MTFLNNMQISLINVIRKISSIFFFLYINTMTITTQLVSSYYAYMNILVIKMFLGFFFNYRKLYIVCRFSPSTPAL